MVLKTKRRSKLADPVTDDAHANLSVGGRLPTFRRIRVLGRLLEARNGFRLRFGRAGPSQGRRGGRYARPLQKTPAGMELRPLESGSVERGELRKLFHRDCLLC